jgi:hypothetical protein
MSVGRIALAATLLAALALSQNDVAWGGLNGDGNVDALFANLGQVNRRCLGDGVSGFACADVSADTNSSWGVALTTVQWLVLTVNKAGTGTGTVTSDPAGVNCGADCTDSFIEDTDVTLTAHPGLKSYLAGWIGDCSGTNPTTSVTMDTDKHCIATFGYPVGGIVVPVDKGEVISPIEQGNPAPTL